MTVSVHHVRTMVHVLTILTRTNAVVCQASPVPTVKSVRYFSEYLVTSLKSRFFCRKLKVYGIPWISSLQGISLKSFFLICAALLLVSKSIF